MKLIIDSGNTLVKMAIFRGDEMIFSDRAEVPSLEWMEDVVKRYPVTDAIFCDVRGTDQQWTDVLASTQRVIRMTGLTPVPLSLGYDTPETLGPDRLAAAVFGAKMFEGHNVLIVQVGTCITYDLVTHDNTYFGGAISPGLDMKLKALHTFTGKLPLIQKAGVESYTGTNTRDSILSGVIYGSIAEIQGMIEHFHETYTGLKVIIGGGDTFYFDGKLKNGIFAVENLVIKGLNLILDYNVNIEKARKHP